MCHTTDVTPVNAAHRMNLRLLAAMAAVLLCIALQSARAQESTDELEVVVVTGRQPGPPLWKVTHGDNALWILPLVPVVPKNIEWDDSRVAGLIAEADEVVEPPGVSVGVSKLLLLNPVNWVRGPKLYKRLSHNPGKVSLQEVLPPDSWERYATLKQRYFPRDKDIETLRPAFAIGAMSKPILEAEKLTGPGDIERRVQKLIRKQRSLRRTEVEIEEKVEGSYADLSARLEKMVDSLPKDDEIACFNTQLELYARRIDDMKRVANAWATGNARGIERYSTLGEMEDPCTRLLLASTEGGYAEKLIEQSSQRWLEAAESALARNRTTFSTLPMIRITGALSLVDKLEARGYTVHAPR